VVPDGVGHQLVGGVFAVPPHREQALFALLDDGDGLGLLEYVAGVPAP